MLSNPRRCLDRYFEIWGTGASYRMVGQMEPYWSLKPVMVLMILNSREGSLIRNIENVLWIRKAELSFFPFFSFPFSFLSSHGWKAPAPTASPSCVAPTSPKPWHWYSHTKIGCSRTPALSAIKGIVLCGPRSLSGRCSFGHRRVFIT